MGTAEHVIVDDQHPHDDTPLHHTRNISGDRFGNKLMLIRTRVFLCKRVRREPICENSKKVIVPEGLKENFYLLRLVIVGKLAWLVRPFTAG